MFDILSRYLFGMTILSELGRAVKQRRLDMGLSQNRLAELANLSRTTVNELETGRLTNLSLTRAEHLANLLGYGLGVTGLRQTEDHSGAFERASRAASVSFAQIMPTEKLRDSLLRGFVPPDYIPHLRVLLDEASVGLLSSVAAQCEREDGVRTKVTWQIMRQLAKSVGCLRPLWS